MELRNHHFVTSHITEPAYELNDVVPLNFKTFTFCNRDYYGPEKKLRKGNVFTIVCQEFCPRGVVGTYPQADRQTPPLPQDGYCILVECILVYSAVLCFTIPHTLCSYPSRLSCLFRNPSLCFLRDQLNIESD